MIACGSGPSDNPCTSADLIPGQLKAVMNDTEWQASGVVWNASGESVQINTDTSDGWRLSIVLQRTLDDTAALSLMSSDGPWDFDLGPDGGGWVTAYPQTGDSANSRHNGSGSFTLSKLDN